MSQLDKEKRNQKAAIKNSFENMINSVVELTVNGSTYLLKEGARNLYGLRDGLLAAQYQGKTTMRFSGVDTIYEISVSDMENLIAQLTIWKDIQWNKKADYYEQINAVAVANYSSEMAAMNAVNAIIWA